MSDRTTIQPKLIIMTKSRDKEADMVDEHRIQKIPIPMLRCTDKKKLLRRWLNQRCSYSDNLFADPGYSDYYKREFNIMDGLGSKPFYAAQGDIDIEMNMGYIDYAHGAEKDPDDLVIEQFIDYIPVNVPHDVIRTATMNTFYEEKQDITDKMTRKNILILPGSNHSNANFLFKRLSRRLADGNVSYAIPFVSGDPTSVYKGTHKDAKMDINKEQLYEFLHQNSKNK